VVGRTHKDWLATDIARIVAMGKAVSDGMATVDETFPPDTAVSSAPTAQQPGSTEETTAAPSDTDTPSAKPSPNGPSPGAPAGRMSAEPPPDKPKPQVSVTTGKYVEVPRSKDEYLAMVRTVCFAATDIETLRAWFVSDQQRKTRNGAGMIAADTQEARELVLARIKELEV
jgi:hypothetical protein